MTSNKKAADGKTSKAKSAVKAVKDLGTKVTGATPKSRQKFVPSKYLDGARILASTVRMGRVVRFTTSTGCSYALPRDEYDSLPKKV